MYTMAFDTSTRSGSVALLKQDSVLAEILLNSGKNHSESVLPAVGEVLRFSGLQIRDVDLFAVTSGPGSFTGLRIGISIVKGLALAASKPVAAVSTLDALAYNLFYAPMAICPLLDAKKGQIYAAVYRPRKSGAPERAGPEVVADPQAFFASIRQDVIFTGDGATIYVHLMEKMLRGRFYVAPLHLRFIRASAVGLLAREKFIAGHTDDVIRLAPSYIRSPGVEANA